MFLCRFVLSTSVIALSTGVATAQTTTNGSNVSRVEDRGTNNQAVVSNSAQGNDNNSSTVVFDGQGHRATVTQVGDNNSSEARLTGVSNRTDVSQNGNQHQSFVQQVGFSNVVSLSQAEGDRNSSIINQELDPRIGSYGNRQASVDQRGSDNRSTVRQVHWDNSATVVQQSQGSESIVRQLSAGNIARVQIFEGFNSSFIEQTHIDPIVTRSTANVLLRGYANRSTIYQVGGLHLSDVSMVGGGEGIDRRLGRERGNFGEIYQYGDLGHVARVSVGGRLSTPAIGNSFSVEQRGSHPSVQAFAQVWQHGEGDDLSIRQILLGGEEGGGFADVSQRGRLNDISLTQYGRQFATLTQGLGSFSSLTLRQYDSGGFVDREPRSAQSPHRGNNTFFAAQYGFGNGFSGEQRGADNRATVSQQVGSADNSIELNQGTNSTAVEGASQCQSGCQFVSGASAAFRQGGSFNSARVNQYGAQHSAQVEQFGSVAGGFGKNLVVITQTGSIGNRAKVLQTSTVASSALGDPASGNSAAQNQQASGDPNATADAYYFAGGQRNAEARIFQTGANSTASIEQRGRGQFALIEQSGSNNEASILQDVAATNATAVIQQTGNGNSYSVTQSEAGQYIHVRQSGNNNLVTNVIQRP